MKAEIWRRGFTLRQVADRLGLTEQSFGQMLKKDKIKTSLIEAAAEVMEIPAEELAGSGDTISAKDHSLAFKGINTCDARLLDVIQSRDRQLDKFQEQLDKSQQHIDRLLSILEIKQESKK